MQLNKKISRKVIIEHIKNVIEDKTKQLADHLINHATLESKLDFAKSFTKEETDRFESLSRQLAGKTQKEHEKFISKLDPLETTRMREYIEKKNDILNLAFAIKGIKEHEEFLVNTAELLEEIESEESTDSTSDLEVKIIT